MGLTYDKINIISNNLIRLQQVIGEKNEGMSQLIGYIEEELKEIPLHDFIHHFNHCILDYNKSVKTYIYLKDIPTTIKLLSSPHYVNSEIRVFMELYIEDLVQKLKSTEDRYTKNMIQKSLVDTLDLVIEYDKKTEDATDTSRLPIAISNELKKELNKFYGSNRLVLCLLNKVVDMRPVVDTVAGEKFLTLDKMNDMFRGNQLDDMLLMEVFDFMFDSIQKYKKDKDTYNELVEFVVKEMTYQINKVISVVNDPMELLGIVTSYRKLAGLDGNKQIMFETLVKCINKMVDSEDTGYLEKHTKDDMNYSIDQMVSEGNDLKFQICDCNEYRENSLVKLESILHVYHKYKDNRMMMESPIVLKSIQKLSLIAIQILARYYEKGFVKVINKAIYTNIALFLENLVETLDRNIKPIYDLTYMGIEQLLISFNADKADMLKLPQLTKYGIVAFSNKKNDVILSDGTIVNLTDSRLFEEGLDKQLLTILLDHPYFGSRKFRTTFLSLSDIAGKLGVYYNDIVTDVHKFLENLFFTDSVICFDNIRELSKLIYNIDITAEQSVKILLDNPSLINYLDDKSFARVYSVDAEIVKHIKIIDEKVVKTDNNIIDNTFSLELDFSELSALLFKSDDEAFSERLITPYQVLKFIRHTKSSLYTSHLAHQAETYSLLYSIIFKESDYILSQCQE